MSAAVWVCLAAWWLLGRVVLVLLVGRRRRIVREDAETAETVAWLRSMREVTR